MTSFASAGLGGGSSSSSSLKNAMIAAHKAAKQKRKRSDGAALARPGMGEFYDGSSIKLHAPNHKQIAARMSFSGTGHTLRDAVLSTLDRYV